jgi:hypothetical protein
VNPKACSKKAETTWKKAETTCSRGACAKIYNLSRGFAAYTPKPHFDGSGDNPLATSSHAIALEVIRYKPSHSLCVALRSQLV